MRHFSEDPNFHLSFMTKILKFIAFVLVSVLIICGYSFLTNKTCYKEWSITKLKSDISKISWVKFVWTNDTISGKYFTRTSMEIPCKIGELPYNFSFQFDLGSYTGIYENTAISFNEKYPEWKIRIVRLRSPLQFWFNKKASRDLTLLFGKYIAKNKLSNYYQNYGEKINTKKYSSNDTFHIGTIGADLFQGKVLIIDYPNQQFAICDTIPSNYNCNFSSIELDAEGRVLLPMKINSKNYKTLFDNGSSLFPLIVTDDKINSFSTLQNTDTLKINAWGKPITMIGRPLNNSIILAGITFNNIKVYADYRHEMRTDKFDAITGNVLFWDKTIMIDFKNRKFGVK